MTTLTLPELHLAVRDLVTRAGLSLFLLNLQIREDHPGRVEVVFSVWVQREPRDPIFCKSREAAVVLDMLRHALSPVAVAPLDELVALGAVPEETER